jgi:FAD/FMN-containing dehydrogenase
MNVAGEVLVPSSPGYESARRSQIARFDAVRPRAVVRCRAAEDVAHVLLSARRDGLHVALRSGGHCFAGRSSTTGIIIDVSGIDAVSVSDGTATVGAGARLGALYDALTAHGRTIAAGCGPTVGIAGLTLGGGLGILGRAHGLTADQLIAARAVLADGRIVDCDERRHQDLFWALRGAGGGQFAAVTQLVFRTLPAPDATAFHLVWPWTMAAAVVGVWQAWAPQAPDTIAASLLIRASHANRPPLVTVFGAVVDHEAAARGTLGEFVGAVGAPPGSERYAPGPYHEVKRYLAEYDVASGERHPAEREPGDSYSKSEFFRRELPADLIGELLAWFAQGRHQGEARVLDFTPWGGAYNRVPAKATAFAHRAERFLLKQEVILEPNASPADRQAARGWLSRSWALAHGSGSGGVYPNFPDPELEDWGGAYHGANLGRLRRVKATYDPENVFRFDQSIRP